MMSKGNHPAIIVIAYNRPDSLSRLLHSIEGAKYESDDVTLVISIDKSDDSRVSEIADSFIFSHGTKRVIKRTENMGLKKHVLSCSALCHEYGSVIVLEDDLLVSPCFYSYSVAALDATQDDDRIAGVSLYNHLLNVHVREPFLAIDDGSDGWYFQFASSWGQAYTCNQWQGFERWMDQNDNTPFSSDFIPENVASWGDSSWLKYYIRYMIETDRYFLYPRAGLTTNFSEAGTHKMGASADLQIPLTYRRDNYSFLRLDDSISVYDAFFENKAMKEGVVFDLYGYRKDIDAQKAKGKSHVISSRVLPYKVEKGYGRELRPVDANVLMDIKGSDFYLYNLEQMASPDDDIKPITKGNNIRKLLYNYRAFKAKYGIEIIKHRLKGR